MEISLVVCTYNRCESLVRTLRSVVASKLPDAWTWEVVVVDNNSRDQTRHVIEEFSGRYPGRFRYVFEPNQGLSHARNAGIRLARGEIIAFTDDDATVDPLWLHNLTAPLQDTRWAGGGGRIWLQQDFLPPNWMAIRGPFNLGGSLGQFDLGEREGPLDRAPYGGNMAFRRSIFHKYGAFRTDLGRRAGNMIGNEDTEFGERLMSAGEHLWYSPSAIVYHELGEHRYTKKYLRSYWFGYGRSRALQARQELPIWKVPRYCLAELRRRLRYVSSLDRHWFLNPQGRFFCEVQVICAIGQTMESYRQSFHSSTGTNRSEDHAETDKRTWLSSRNESTVLAIGSKSNDPSTGKLPTVIIVGPPWPRSGTARIIQNQIQYYRQRGFQTLFIAVAYRWHYTNANPLWDELRDGINELGADYTTVAAIEPRSYMIAKYTASVRHALRGTALDWLVAVGRSAQMPAEAMNLVRDLPVALFHVNHVYTLGFALRLRKQLGHATGRVPVILETHDIQSRVLQDRSERNPWTRRPDSLERLLQSEIALLNNADVLVHLSIDDSKFFGERLTSKPQFLAFPTIDQDFVSLVNATPPPAETIDVLFVGDWHPPNLAAIQWFFEQVWPLIAWRGYNLKIVGRIGLDVRLKLPRLYNAYCSCFVGEVADLALYYRAARCVIAPMVSGSGTSIKTIEALALGKPFVGTSKAFRGMPMEDLKEAGMQAYDDPRAFADAIVCALTTGHHAERSSRAAYDRIFSTQASFASRDQALRVAQRASNPAKVLD